MNQLSFKTFHSFERIWLGAIRLPTAATQFEFEWVNGFKRDSRESSWIIQEDTWDKKCVYYFLNKRTEKPLFHLTYCDDTLYFNHVVCEHSLPKQKCKSSHDCHQLASCMHGTCFCQKGFTGDGHHCYDIDECSYFKGSSQKFEICALTPQYNTIFDVFSR